MKGHFGKVGVLFLVLALVLTGIGVGVAHWTDTLFIEGDVSTGVLDAEISAGMSWDTEPPEKDVSSISCWVDPADPKTLIVEVLNAYPCIDYYQEFDVHNTGTIPLHIGNLTVNSGTLPAGCYTLEISDLECEQLHPCDVVWGEIHLHLDNCAEQDTSYCFSAEIAIEQWNADQF